MNAFAYTLDRGSGISLNKFRVWIVGNWLVKVNWTAGIWGWGCLIG